MMETSWSVARARMLAKLTKLERLEAAVIALRDARRLPSSNDPAAERRREEAVKAACRALEEAVENA